MNPPASNRSWQSSLSVYRQRHVVAMLFLGFSAGLPLLLVFGTLSAWLRAEGIDRSTIGYISWVAMLYGLKFLWSPLVDRLPIPILTHYFGQRRSWMLFAQGGVITGLLLMANINPGDDLTLLVIAALFVAFCSATQDISLDAWRIESASMQQQGAMAGNYQLGYRLGWLFSGGGALIFAAYFNWQIAYTLMAVAMLVGVVTTLLIPEPKHEQTVVDELNHSDGYIQPILCWLKTAVINPFIDFFQRNGLAAITILAFICLFRISDITMGVMANPFYIDMGYTLSQIAWVSKFFGITITIVGALLGGVLVYKFGIFRMLVISAILVVVTNLVFAWLATHAPPFGFVDAALSTGNLNSEAIQPPHIGLLSLVIAADNLSGGIAGTTFIAYLSSLTNRAYTATQYALFSSLMLLPAKFIGGFSGVVVDEVGYIQFFLYAGGLGIPSILLSIYLYYRTLHARDSSKI